MPVPPGPGKPTVKFAVYGGLKSGNPDNALAKDVTDALQTAINKTAGEVVKIDNGNMGGDPAHLVHKVFGAILVINGQRRAFACEEGQSIDFT